MKKNISKPNEIQARLDTPAGRMGVPPDIFDTGFTVLEDKVIIIADKPTAMRMLGYGRDKGSLPS